MSRRIVVRARAKAGAITVMRLADGRPMLCVKAYNEVIHLILSPAEVERLVGALEPGP